MPKERFDFFSDGVMAIVITIMVLEIGLPVDYSFAGLFEFGRDVFTYMVSFFIVGNYWRRHGELLRGFGGEKGLDKKVVWRNLLFLFSISLLPLFTKWLIASPDSPAPVIAYLVLFGVINLTYQFLLHVTFTEERLKEMAAKYGMDLEESRRRGRTHRWWWAVFALLMGGLVAFAVFFPRVTGVMLIILPTWSALSSFMFDEGEGRGRVRAAREKF